MHTNQILLSSNRLELSPWSFAYVFKKIETTTRWNFMLKGLRFLHITAILQECPFFTVFITIKTSSQNIAMTLLQISLKLLWTILEEQFQVLRNTAASKIGSDTIWLPWQLRCHCNPDHNKFSSLSSTTVGAILISKSLFMHGDVVYAQTWEVLTLENCIEPPQQDVADKGNRNQKLRNCLVAKTVMNSYNLFNLGLGLFQREFLRNGISGSKFQR